MNTVAQSESPRKPVHHAALYRAAQRTYAATWTDAGGTRVGTAREVWTTGAILEFHLDAHGETFLVRRADPRLALGEDLAERQARATRLARLAALAVLVARAALRYPTEQTRLERGRRRVADGAVALHADGTATVRSQSGQGVSSGGNGTYPCQDFRRHGHVCQHRWGRMLPRKLQHEGA